MADDGPGLRQNETTAAAAAPEEPLGASEAGETGRAAAASRLMARPTPRSVADRITIWVVRGVFIVVSAGLGIQGVVTFSPGSSIAPGILVGCAVALGLIVLEALFARSPIRTIAAISFGLFIGLILSAVFQHVVRMIAQAVTPSLEAASLESLLSFLNLMTTSIFCYFGITLLLSTKEDFRFIIPYVEFRREVKSQLPLILDTSAFIDGRIQALLATGVLDQRLVVPRFVLDELQSLADSADRSLRERGRRGMDILQDIQRNHWVEVVEEVLDEGEDVDLGLLRLAAAHEGKIVTTDYNLTKRGRLQALKVLNINDLATAMKPVLVPGEKVRVRLLREGEEAGQAVGFLRDGTMVVVEQARDRIGQEVSVEVTSAIQTSAGKMAFGRLSRGAGKGRGRR